MRTYTGRLVNPLALKPEDIDIRDISHSLSNICRYNGHSAWHYSVCQHSVYVAMMLDALNPTLQLKGLLHDAAEAYLCDIPRPLKNTPEFAFYHTVEDSAMGAIYQAFGLGDFGTGSSDYGNIKYADNAVLVAEGLVLMSEAYNIGISPAPIRIEQIQPNQAEDLFLGLYGELIGKRHFGLAFQS